MWKERKLSLSTDNMIVYVENTKTYPPPKKKIWNSNKYGNVSGHKFNIQKSDAFLYTSNEQLEL